MSIFDTMTEAERQEYLCEVMENQGFQRGFEDGGIQVREEMALNLLRMRRLSVEEIAQATDLAGSRVSELAKNAGLA